MLMALDELVGEWVGVRVKVSHNIRRLVLSDIRLLADKLVSHKIIIMAFQPRHINKILCLLDCLPTRTPVCSLAPVVFYIIIKFFYVESLVNNVVLL